MLLSPSWLRSLKYGAPCKRTSRAQSRRSSCRGCAKAPEIGAKLCFPHHSSLLTDPDIRTFIKVNSNGKLLPIFEKSRAGDKKVTGFIPAAEGVDFSVGWYCGRTKNLKSSILIEVYFGETLWVYAGTRQICARHALFCSAGSA